MSDELEWDDDENFEWTDPFRLCYTCRGDGSSLCPCAAEHVVVAYCFRCDDEEILECPDCDGWGMLLR